MKRLFILLLFVFVCLLSTGCNSTNYSDSQSSSETESKPQENVPSATEDIKVAYMKDSMAWYDAESNNYILVFSLTNKSGKEICTSVNVDISIKDTANQILFENQFSLTESDYKSWTYKDGTIKYQATIYINKDNVTKGNSENGKIHLVVSKGNEFTFNEVKTDINNLPHYIKPTNITLNAITDSIYIGDSSTITATILPENTDYPDIVWSSSDSSIATVNENGLVTGISAGTVNITAITTNGIETSYTLQVKKKTSLETPECPIEVWSYAKHKIYSKMILTNISYEIVKNRDNTITVYAYFTGEVTYIDFTYANFEWKLCDKDGYIIETGNVHLQGLDVGDKFKDKKVTILSFATPGEYRLEVSDLKY